MNLLPANLASLASLAASETSRYSMTGVQVSFDHDGTYTAVATDGRYMGIATGPVPESSEYPAPPAVANAPNTATSAVIPTDEWKDAFKAMPKRKRGQYTPPIYTEYLACVPSWETIPSAEPNGKPEVVGTCLLASTDGRKESVANVRNVEGRFPDYRHVLPGGAPTATVDLDPKRLRELLAVAERFTDGRRVTLEVRANGAPVVLRVQGKDGQQFTGLLMPLS